MATKKQVEAKKTTKVTKKEDDKVKKVAKKEQEIKKAKKLLTNNGIHITEDGEVVVDQSIQDFRSAVLVLSLAINLVVFITWIILQYTTCFLASLIARLLPYMEFSTFFGKFVENYFISVLILVFTHDCGKIYIKLQ